ncbi:hypothetical protein RHOSPDRAFT_17883 [Rhodotorula sp. JG-1b]|nr:hypothetical protein RHOSPDRAFT_17883 [Rhodotorula sp. JG-1b]
MSAGFPSARTIATRCSSPPERVVTYWSMMFSRFIGFRTSVLNCGCMNAARTCFRSSSRTVPGNLGAIVCGLSETEKCCSSAALSGLSLPASSLTKVVLPVPFSPRRTMISESVNEPPCMLSLKLPCVLVMVGYSSTASAILNVSDSSRNRRFSVGILPSRKMLIPSRTENGIVTTPYIDGMPYRQQIKSDR